MRTLVVATAAVLGLASGAAQASPPVAQKDFAAVCPLALPGTTAKAMPTADGVAVEFDTSVASATAELRSRVTKLSDLLNRAVSQPAGAGARPALPFASTYQETKSGGSLVLKPTKAADLEKLQAGVAGKISAMNQGKTCHLLANVN